MRTTIFLSALIIVVILSNACKRDLDLPVVNKQEVDDFLDDRAPEKNSFTIMAPAGGVVTNDSISVTFPANSFSHSDGTPYNGIVNVKMQTVRNTAGMIFSGVTTTAYGQMLISDGMFRLEAYDILNLPLKLRDGVTLSANLMADEFDADSKVFVGIIRNDSDNEVEWQLSSDSAQVTQGPAGTRIFGLDELFTWYNLDRFMNETPLTNITVTIPSGFSNVNARCFLKYAGENSGAYLPANIALEAFSTDGSYYKVVQGRQAKVLIIADKNGKLYYQIEEIPAIGPNHTLNITSLIETSEANLHEVIKSF